MAEQQTRAKQRLSPTVLTTPGIAQLGRLVAHTILKLTGWRAVGTPPSTAQYVMVAAPHTSNWDGIFLVCMASVLRIPIRWLGKHTLFRFPFGPMMRWFGGMPVDRRGRTSLVERTAELFDRYEDLVIVVPPEGTRSRSRGWKTGFYWIADTADVPIALGFLDYATKTGGVGPLFEPTGDLEGDLVRIREFYADKQGLHHDDFGSVETRRKGPPRR